jgi:hypothetical protein
MIPSLNEMIGLPLATSAVELDFASEKRFESVLERASQGDPNAQRELSRCVSPTSLGVCQPAARGEQAGTCVTASAQESGRPTRVLH